MRKSLILLALVAGCGAAERDGDNAAAGDGNGTAPAASARGGGEGAGPAPATLVGLYESGSGDQKNQLCMVDKGKGTQFGLIVWGSDLHSCSGAGSAIRSGDRLTLNMAGDSSCSIDATIADGTITLPDAVPEGCAYYCGARATMTGTRFTRIGATAADAARARDLAGDPLC